MFLYFTHPLFQTLPFLCSLSHNPSLSSPHTQYDTTFLLLLHKRHNPFLFSPRPRDILNVLRSIQVLAFNKRTQTSISSRSSRSLAIFCIFVCCIGFSWWWIYDFFLQNLKFNLLNIELVLPISNHPPNPYFFLPDNRRIRALKRTKVDTFFSLAVVHRFKVFRPISDQTQLLSAPKRYYT